MRTLLLLFVASLAMLSSMARAGDSCRSIGDRIHPVQSKVCSAKDGSGAYYLVRNKGRYSANACWEVMFRDGSRQEACRDGLVKTQPVRVECEACGRKGGNVLFITVKSYVTPDAPVKQPRGKRAPKEASVEAEAPVSGQDSGRRAAAEAAEPALAGEGSNVPATGDAVGQSAVVPQAGVVAQEASDAAAASAVSADPGQSAAEPARE